MPSFFYTAKSFDGKIITGNSDAKDVRDLAQSLRSEGLILVKADAKGEKSKRWFMAGSFQRNVSITEKILMTRNLLVMISTGLPLVRGFSILAAQSKSKKMKKALLDIGQEISKGKTLTESFEKYPDIFSELYRGMIQAGEESGTLEEVLSVLSLQLEKEKEMKSKVKKALIYPTILVLALVIVGIFLMIFVLPKINAFFQGLNANLPLTTKIILGSGDFMMNYWHFFTFGTIIFILSATMALKTKSGKIFIDTISLRIPIISKLIKENNSALLIRSLSSLLAAGVSLIRALEISSGTVSNFYFKRALSDASQKIEKGEKLSVSLELHKNIFPYGTLEIIEVGEETGKTSMILKKLAEFYEEEVSNMADNLSIIIEPLLIVVIGILVGIFAVSIMGPLYSVLGTI